VSPGTEACHSSAYSGRSTCRNKPRSARTVHCWSQVPPRRTFSFLMSGERSVLTERSHWSRSCCQAQTTVRRPATRLLSHKHSLHGAQAPGCLAPGLPARPTRLAVAPCSSHLPQTRAADVAHDALLHGARRQARARQGRLDGRRAQLRRRQRRQRALEAPKRRTRRADDAHLCADAPVLAHNRAAARPSLPGSCQKRMPQNLAVQAAVCSCGRMPDLCTEPTHLARGHSCQAGAVNLHNRGATAGVLRRAGDVQAGLGAHRTGVPSLPA